MNHLKPYEIPEHIQSGIDAEFLNIDEARSNDSDYISSLKAMIHMEELANSGEVHQYNIKNAQIQFHMDNIFKTTRTVSITQHLILSIYTNLFLKLKPKRFFQFLSISNSLIYAT